MVGDGSYLMMISRDRHRRCRKGYKLTIVLLDNDGFKSIGALSRSLGQEGFGTRYRLPARGHAAGRRGRGAVQPLPVDLAANARSLGAHVIDLPRATTSSPPPWQAAQATDRTTVIYIQNDRYASVPGYESWWDVPVAEVSERESVRQARAEWQTMRAKERLWW